MLRSNRRFSLAPLTQSLEKRLSIEGEIEQSRTADLLIALSASEVGSTAWKTFRLVLVFFKLSDETVTVAFQANSELQTVEPSVNALRGQSSLAGDGSCFHRFRNLRCVSRRGVGACIDISDVVAAKIHRATRNDRRGGKQNQAQ